MTKKTEFYRMLKVWEVKKMEDAIPKIEYRMSFKTAIHTGMRYLELLGFKEHPEWFNFKRLIIVLPKSFTKTDSERKVNLTPQFAEILNYYFLGNNNLVYPERHQAWTDNLRRWAAKAGLEHPEDITSGSTRKAWESWLIESGYPISKILASQGHDLNTSMRHYYNNDVTPDEREAMKKETSGWT